ncbi:MAG: Gfo/Idh/MocA family oxidoreductase [Clostridia bacterium]|nr:Gfo/Idh/MocA family oxidoreductase [Clostridia bacterium]
MKEVRWGIAGPGDIANKFARAVANVEGATVTAVASRSMEKGEEFAKKYGIEHVFEGYDKMAESDVIDAVYICTPHRFHYEIAKMYLEKGKHVLCEKSICVNEEQILDLQKCAKDKNLFLMEAMWTRFLPALKEVRQVIESGEIGEIRAVEADFCFGIPTEANPKLFDVSLAGGATLDVGVYSLTFASMFLGDDYEKLYAVADVKEGVDLHTVILIKYKNGAIANLSGGIGVNKPEGAYIYGTKGQIFVPAFFAASEYDVVIDNETKHVKKPPIAGGFEEEIIEACSCIRNGKTESDIMPVEQSVRICRQMDEVRRQIGVRYDFAGE